MSSEELNNSFFGFGEEHYVNIARGTVYEGPFYVSQGIKGFGYAYDGWKVGSLDGGAYVLSKIPMITSYTNKKLVGTMFEEAWKAATTVLSDPMDLIRLELLEGL